MHSHDRTLIARLGFEDPDKKDPRHDLACQFLATEQNGSKLAPYFHARTYGTPSRVEVPISKGEGKYRVVAGFADVVVFMEVPHYCSHRCKCRPKEVGPVWDIGPGFAAMIEVKIAKLSINEILRQILFYQASWTSDTEDVEFAKWVLATPWPLNSVERELLKTEDILHIRLADGFEKFCADVKQRPVVESDSEF